jgi:hypothetical protein
MVKLERWEADAIDNLKKYFKETRISVSVKPIGNLKVHISSYDRDEANEALDLLKLDRVKGLPDSISCGGGKCGFMVDMKKDEKFWQRVSNN